MAEKFGKEKWQAHRDYETEHPPCFHPTRQLFHRSSSCPDSHVTSKQIRAWIRKGILEAFDLPGLGLIIEADRLNEFLYKRDLDSQ
jgi:hypothetical protein